MIRKDGGKTIILYAAFVCLNPYVEESFNPAILPLLTKTRAKLTFSKDNLSTPRRTSLVITILKTSPRLLTTDGYIL